MRRFLLLAGGLVALAGAPPPLDAQAAPDTAQVAKARRQISDGAYGEAAALLRDWLRRHPGAHGVRWLLARTLYWEGDFAEARRQLRRTLETEPGYRPALELWREMRSLWAPRIRTRARVDDDVQPLTRQRLALETDLPLGARVELLARAEVRRLEAGEADPATVIEGRAGLSADLRVLEIEALAGAAGRPDRDRGDLVGSASVGVALPAGLELTAAGRRWSYEHTVGAVDSALLVETAGGRLGRSDPTGWAGQAGGRVDRFPDGNEILHGWAWILAPVWSAGRSAVRVGYSFAARDARASRFVPLSSDGPSPGPGPPGPPGTGSAGGYDPYYTPEDVRVHSALAAVQAAVAPGVLLTADGTVGVHAREDAPRPDAGAGPGGVAFVERSFTPWRVRAALSAELSPAATLRIRGGYREDAFFRIWHASAELEWRLLGGLSGP